jgi:glycosyltransferase 2 family protein
MSDKKIAVFTLRFVVAAILLAAILNAVDPSKIKQDLEGLQIDHLALLIVISWIGQLFCAQRWRLFASAQGMQESYSTFFQIYFLGMLFNVGLPSLVGGDTVKAYLISRKTGKALHNGFASVLQDRAVGLISLLIYGSGAVLLCPLTWRGLPLWLLYGLVWIGIALFLWLIWKGDLVYRKYLVAGSRSLFQRGLALLASFHDSLTNVRGPAGSLIQIVAISFFNSGLVLWTLQQVSVAAGNPVDLLAFSALFPLIAVVTMLPISLGGLGIREWAYVEGLALLEVPPDIALTIALATSALMIVADLVGIFFLPVVKTVESAESKQ